MREIVLLMGNIGAGKTTIARKYAEKGYIILDQDSLREMFGAGNYVYTQQTEEIIKRLTRHLLLEFLNTDLNLVIDGCLVEKARRDYIMGMVVVYSPKSQVTIIVFPRYPKKFCVDRRMKTARGFTRKVWNSVWDKFNAKWEFPAPEEGFDHIVVLPDMRKKGRSK